MFSQNTSAKIKKQFSVQAVSLNAKGQKHVIFRDKKINPQKVPKPH
ncbi:hypothetical protein DGWBC_0217 [Dehalogenimonas sp. WBC-2]|nr:hypothetical protein DGWBC_0217 [Dehalogenimonas sp. WBC-2]